MSKVSYRPAQGDDADALAKIRVAAMRPSLEAIGRFDPERARHRFLSAFDPSKTTVILKDDQVVGFFVSQDLADHIWLDHLYIVPTAQGAGLGRCVVRKVQAQANKMGLPIRLMALRDSPANAFYTSLGFVQVREETYDIYYQWTAELRPGRSRHD